LATDAPPKMPSTLPRFLFFSAIHFLFFRDVFSVLSAKAFAKPAPFITLMTNS
jgi:hypothetical protein